MALMTLPEAARVETALSVGKTGSAASRPSGSSFDWTRSNSAFLSALAAAHASKDFCHSACSAWPLATAPRVYSRTSGATSKVLSVSKPRISLRPLISSAPSAEPWILPEFCLVGDGQPMIVLRTMSRVELLDVLGVLAGLLPVDDLDVPAERLVAVGDALRERDVGVVLDRDLVRVVERDEVAELLTAGERAGLVRHAFLHVTVAGDHVGVVVERRLAGRGLRVEQAALEALGVGEADRGREALAERARGDLDTVGVAVLRVTRGLRAPLAQVLQVVDLEPVAVQVELHVLEDRGVTGGEDEAVAADPGGVARVATHHLLEEQVGERSEAHRGAGVTVAGGLDRVGGENAGRVDGLPVDGVPGEFSHLDVDPS
jgi:hypothetical protein